MRKMLLVNIVRTTYNRVVHSKADHHDQVSASKDHTMKIKQARDVKAIIESRLSDALEMLDAGFTTKAAQKRALESLSKAYEEARRDIQSQLIDKRRGEIEANHDAKTDEFYYDIPQELHHWRVKHAVAAMEVSRSMTNPELITWMVVKIAALSEARSTIKDTAIVAAEKNVTKIDLANPITAAIEPLRQISVDNAVAKANRIIAKAHKELAEGGYDLRVVAPRLIPTLSSQEDCDRNTAIRALYTSLTDCKHSTGNSNMRVPSHEAEARFIEQTKEAASFQFDKYVAKMISKIGDVDSAELTHSFENDIWGYSVLTVVIAGATQRWHTQQIVNTSKLGKLFNQWPTRLMR